MLSRVQVEHEVRQRTLQLCAQVPVNCKARPSQLHRAFQVKHSQLLADLPVRLGSKIKLRRRSPAAHLHIFFGAVADGHTRVRQVGNTRENVPQPNIEISGSLLQSLNLLAHFLGLRHGGAGVLPSLPCLGNLLRGLVALRLHSLRRRDGVPALRIDLVEILEHGSRIHAALTQLLFHQRQIVADKIQIKHGFRSTETTTLSETAQKMHATPSAVPVLPCVPLCPLW